MILLLTEHIPNLIGQIQSDLQKRYGITDAQVSTRFIRDLPRDEDGYSIRHLKEQCVTDYYPLKDVALYVDDMTDIQTLADVVASQYINPQITWTDDIAVAQQWLTGIEQTYDTIAVDFEAIDLTLPQFNQLTMVTIGWQLTKSVVIVFKDKQITDFVLDWLVTTNCRQVYHNALFDTRLIHYFTGKLPKHIEDSQLLAAVYKNHVNPDKRKSGLKELAKYPYLDWASDKSSFELYVDSSEYVNPNLHYIGSNPTPHMYNLPLIYYCGVDACATHFVWSKFDTEPAHPTEWIPQTSEPRYNTEEFNQRYYYDFILKPAIPVIVRMLNKGQPIDIEQVKTLSAQVEHIKQECISKINSYKLVQDFQAPVDAERIRKFIEPVQKAWAHPKYTGYQSNPAMRAFVVNCLIGTNYETLSDKELKQLADPKLQPLLDKQYDYPDIVAACNLFAELKAHKQNLDNNRIDKIENPGKYVQLGFNPYNYQQLAKMWVSFGLESDEVSKDTGQMSFSSDVLSELVKTTSGDIQEILKLYLEIAESKNMITQYIPKYLGSTVDGRVYGSIRLFGTISGRLSGKAAKLTDDIKRHQTGINLVTQPASSSAFAKPVKKLFRSMPGKLLVAIDYANLEGHVGAILTHDETSVRNLKQNFDTHCLHSAAYWTEQWESIEGAPKFDLTSLEVNKQYKALCDTNPIAKKLRNNSKGVTFGLAYGAYPPKVAKSIGCDIEEATTIFNNFHNLLYPGVTKYREEYVLPQTSKHGWIHLNWGLKLFTDNAKKDIRTSNNSTMQSYSNLTQIAAVEFDSVKQQSQYNTDIDLIGIVHDCLYYEVTDDIQTIKYLNDNLPAIMCKQFINDQELQIKAEIDIGPSLAHMVTLPNNIDLATIEAKLATLKDD